MADAPQHLIQQAPALSTVITRGGLQQLQQREAHHLHAFVRFIALPAEAGPELPEYVAWHEPGHDILKSGQN